MQYMTRYLREQTDIDKRERHELRKREMWGSDLRGRWVGGGVGGRRKEGREE